jgi:hypothetical protein
MAVDTLPPTALSQGHRVLYHWQPYHGDRLASLLRDRLIYLASPDAFNDPWDCKPYFNTAILENTEERERHIEWAGRICREHHGYSEADVLRLQQSLRADRGKHEDMLRQLSHEIWAEIAKRYRVYCLSPELLNVLMWSHYADDHKGICLEFSTRNDVMCCALRCEYLHEFPLTRAYSTADAENLGMLLAKAHPWHYENEYRLIAEERAHSLVADSLKTNGGLLTLPNGALTAVIVGCQGPYDEVRRLAAAYAPDVAVRRAIRVPNRYELAVVG